LTTGEDAAISPFRVPSTNARVTRMRFSLDPDADDPAAWSLGPEAPDTVVGPLNILPTTLQETGAFGRGALTLLPWRLDVSPEPDEIQEDADLESSTLTSPAPSSVPERVPSESPELKVPGRQATALESASLQVVEAIEHALIAVLIEAVRGIERRLDGGDKEKLICAIPSTADQTAAHAALDGLHADGVLSADEVRSRRDRLAAIGEAGPRLRSLLELHQAALLTDAQLATRRADIIAPLACVLKGAEASG
jgi:hypothetical protein